MVFNIAVEQTHVHKSNQRTALHHRPQQERISVYTEIGNANADSRHRSLQFR